MFGYINKKKNRKEMRDKLNKLVDAIHSECHWVMSGKTTFLVNTSPEVREMIEDTKYFYLSEHNKSIEKIRELIKELV